MKPREHWRGLPLEQRLVGFKGIYILHPQLVDAINFIKDKLSHSRLTGRSDAVLVIIDSGGGKSSLCEYLERLWPDENKPDVTLRRVVRIAIPRPCTAAELAKELLRALGDPCWETGSAKKNRRRALELLDRCGTWLLLIDNFHDIPERRKTPGVRVIGNWFRDFIDEVHLVLVGLGLEPAAEVMLFNNQVHRRIMATKRVDYFTIDTAEHARIWVKALHDIDSALPLAEVSNLHDQNLRWRLYFATNGIFDYLMKLLEHALCTAVMRGSERIEIPDLLVAYMRCHGDVLPDSNPFSEAFKPRHLNEPQEPFYVPVVGAVQRTSSAAVAT